jgi:hypothetical protein
MGQLNNDPSLWLLQTIKNLQNQVTALATQQQYSVANSQADAILTVGNFPGTPITYGMKVYNVSTGNTVLSIGYNADGSYALEAFNSAGDVILALGENADGTNSLEVFDTSGNLRTALGQLASGDYGLAVTDPHGVTNEVFPVSSKYVNGPLATSSTTPFAITGSPSVTAYLGASGDALVTVCCLMNTGITSTLGEVDLWVDGSSYGSALFMGYPSSAGSAVEASCSTTRRLSDWEGALPANGNHVFTLRYSSSAGTSIGFNAISIVVQPL